MIYSIKNTVFIIREAPAAVLFGIWPLLRSDYIDIGLVLKYESDVCTGILVSCILFKSGSSSEHGVPFEKSEGVPPAFFGFLTPLITVGSTAWNSTATRGPFVEKLALRDTNALARHCKLEGRRIERALLIMV